MHLFGHTFDHDYYFELPVKGAGYPINFSVLSAHHRDFRAFPRTNPKTAASGAGLAPPQRVGDRGAIKSKPVHRHDQTRTTLKTRAYSEFP
jgi:hypothetical protein